jgi:hypothetical protein
LAFPTIDVGGLIDLFKKTPMKQTINMEPNKTEHKMIEKFKNKKKLTRS